MPRRSIRFAAALSALALVSACQVSHNGDGTTSYRLSTRDLGSPDGSGSGIPLPSPYPWSSAQFARVEDAEPAAAWFTRTFDKGGMALVVADLSRCYEIATFHVRHGLARPSEMRFCVIYDGLAFAVDNTVAQHRRWPPTPYFETQVASQRWLSHVLDSGFGRMSELREYMVKSVKLGLPYVPSSIRSI